MSVAEKRKTSLSQSERQLLSEILKDHAALIAEEMVKEETPFFAAGGLMPSLSAYKSCKKAVIACSNEWREA